MVITHHVSELLYTEALHFVAVGKQILKSFILRQLKKELLTGPQDLSILSVRADDSIARAREQSHLKGRPTQDNNYKDRVLSGPGRSDPFVLPCQLHWPQYTVYCANKHIPPMCYFRLFCLQLRKMCPSPVDAADENTKVLY